MTLISRKPRLSQKLVLFFLLPVLVLTLLLIYFAFVLPENLSIQQSILLYSGLVVAIGCIILSLLTIRKTGSRIKIVSAVAEILVDGKLQHTPPLNGNDELTGISSALHAHNLALKAKADFAGHLEHDRLNETYTPAGQDDSLGLALLKIRDHLLTGNEEDRKRDWTTGALARFVDIMRNDTNLKELTHAVAKNLVTLLNANQGAIFIATDENVLEMLACYAYSRTKHLTMTVAAGEGIIGQAFLEKETVYLKKVPENFVRITSGLGEANPRCILLCPLKVKEDVVGIVEIASFREFEAHEIAFVEKIGETIAHTVLSFRSAEKTKKLLQDAQEHAEHMRAQEEELRQNQEELQATQEEISRKYNALFKQLKELNYESRFDQLRSITSTKKRNVEYYFDIIRNQILTFSENTMIVNAMKEFASAYYALESTPADQLPAMQKRVARYYKEEFITRLQDNVDQAESINYFVPQEKVALILQDRYIANNPNPTGKKSSLDDPKDGTDYSRVHARYHPLLRSYLEKFGYYDIFLVDHRTGNIVYSVFKEVDFATSLTMGLYNATNFGVVVREAIASTTRGFVKLADFEPYTPSYQAPASFIACPVYDGTEKIGVLVFQTPINKINQILTGNNHWREDGLGKSGETFMVGHDYTLRSIARELIEDKPHYLSRLKKNNYHDMVIALVDKMDTSILVERVKMEAVTRALRGETGTHIERGNTGEETLNAYAPLDILDVNWVIISSLEEEEASQRIEELRTRA